MRAVIGQQVSVAGARTVSARLVAAVGLPLELDGGQALTHRFPDAGALAGAPDSALAMPAGRRETIRRLASAVADGALQLDAGSDPSAVRHDLMALKGIGAWTADYVAMRGLGHPDVFLPTDLGVVTALDRLGIHPDRSGAWSPWRSYAVHHLWASLPSPSSRQAVRT